MNVPPLVSEELWLKAQERLEMNRKFSARNATRFYLLRSLLVCDVCGRTLVGRSSGASIAYYCTNLGKNRSPDVPVHSRSIRASVIEPLVWQAVVRLLDNPVLLADAWHSETHSETNAPQEQDRLQARLKALERQWQRLLDLFQDEKIEKAELVNASNISNKNGKPFRPDWNNSRHWRDAPPPKKPCCRISRHFATKSNKP